MDDLIAWLPVQLDDDERVARAELELQERLFPAAEFDVEYRWSRQTRFRANGADGVSTAGGVPTPGRVLAEIDAKRRRLARHAPVDDGLIVYCAHCSTPAAGAYARWPCPDVRDDAALYADRAGYRDEWRP